MLLVYKIAKKYPYMCYSKKAMVNWRSFIFKKNCLFIERKPLLKFDILKMLFSYFFFKYFI